MTSLRNSTDDKKKYIIFQFFLQSILLKKTYLICLVPRVALDVAV